MPRRLVDNSSLDRWRSQAATATLVALADHAKPDPTYRPLANPASTRWHASVGRFDYELVCTGPKFLDTRSGRGGGGAVDLAMHLYNVDFKEAVALLRKLGV